MNLKMYYEKIHDLEAQIAEDWAVLVSMETPDGGKAGMRTEAPRRTAARMIVEARARLATAAEAEEFHQQQAAARAEAERAAAAAKMQIAVVTAQELEKLRGAGKTKA